MDYDEKFEAQYMPQSGLIAVSMYGQTVELALEDIDEINDLVMSIGKKNIASREDFLS